MLLLLGAVEAGLGALFFRLHGDPARLRAVLGVPDGWEPIGVVALGWPAADERRPAPAAATCSTRSCTGAGGSQAGW